MSQTMTTKELSVFFGRSTSGLARIAKELGIEMINGKPKLWNKEQVLKISEKIYKTCPAVIRDSIELTFEKEKVDTFQKSKVEKSGIERLCSAVEKLVDHNQSILQAILAKEPKLQFVKEPVSLPSPEPIMKNREKFSSAVKKLANDFKIGYDAAFNKVYDAIRTYLHKDVKKRAENSKKIPIQVLDELNIWDQVFQLISEMYIEQMKQFGKGA